MPDFDPRESDDIPRTVRPMNLVTDDYPIAVVDRSHSNIFLESSGEILTVREVGSKLRHMQSHVFVCIRGGDVLAIWNETLHPNPLWQYRAIPVRGESGKTGIRSVMISYFGFKAEGGRTGTPSNWHYMLDPTVFASYQTLHDDSMAEMLHWGQDVRDWCKDLGIKPKPTSGGLAKQLLRHPMFYADPRRKVPFMTNDHARPTLPGNFHRLYVQPKEVVPMAMEVDMTGAHHWAAATVDLPHADTLRARGNFKGIPDRIEPNSYLPGRPQWEPNGKCFSDVCLSHGLLLIRLQIPRKLRFAPPYMAEPGRRTAYVYTNELDLIRSLGGVIDGIDAAWTSHRVDYNIRKFAKWSQEQLKGMSGERKRWCKSTLLAAYGALAGQRRTLEYGNRTGKGTPTEYPTGSLSLPVMAYVGTKPTEPSIANVIQRGMIEAEIRCEAIRMAIWLDGLGHEILAIYADAIFVRGGVLPLLPAPWRAEGRRTQLTFLSPIAYRSWEKSRLPGVGREERAVIRRLEEMSVGLDRRESALIG